MSADLLAEFGTSGPRTAEDASQIGPDNTMFYDDDGDNDEFDSFVDPEPAHPNEPQFNLTIPSDANIESLYTSRKDLWLPSEPGGEVLFDVSLEATADGEDDWGEFEDASNAPSQPSSRQLIDFGNESQPAVSPKFNAQATQSLSNTPALLDLLSLDDSPTVNYDKASKDTSRQQPSQTTPKIKFGQRVAAKQPTPKNTASEDDFFGEWDDFKDGHAEVPRLSNNHMHSKTLQTTSATPNKLKQGNTRVLNEPQKKSVPEVDIRPTNIPPPSIILQIFPSILDDFRKQVNQGKQEPLKPNPGLVIYLTSTLKAISHVIAGRTLRWKRDTILSQSMKIGPARAGKTSGMKLNSVSKGESIKEEQEVVAVIDSWRNHTAVFNALIQSSGGRPIPVITDKSRINTASPEDGALKASHACALCGLKRDERLPKVDEDVQDSFGEWWAEHWGHADCKQFWEANSKRLYQR
ncbi:hypothetical protein BGW36DRAFT_385427 [Talaromyces proteolyticus]|uniref:Uncharacterized protein n=1 Tax=Talaromyces proteolyticus TaxID=1131652 RepID=A0AAD4PX96_9EURO|nr:uncharacterized protein BGW36DRAFT_385427 [Talaromyces proteolyticus]KAH8692896.1 hypothetical protein BGW36DRAFT_385427 [Talaromyces proteolyticus]